MRIPDFTIPEIEYIKSKANFTIRENELFDLRNKETSLEECAYIMNCSLSTINRLNKAVKRKCMKVL